MYRTFNMGIGFILVVSLADADRTLVKMGQLGKSPGSLAG